MKKVLLEFMDNHDTPEQRITLAARESEKIKATLVIPASIRDNIYEGFDPLLVSREIIDKHLIRVFNTILNFDDSHRTDAEFIDELKSVA
jgi:hypothetical protein